ncbi:MAG: sigma-70 family RNA polymerase sigma factor [Candidatus Aminicenantes bacterium]|nr:sigma-70 family RNA polymerase sigma factor [Candidatus Aminicenantes bacterium]
MDETALIRTAREGDGDAFRTLFDAHNGRVFGLAYKYLRNRADAEDVLQETFIRAYRALDTFDPVKNADFGVWINRICVNCSIDALRRSRRRSAQPLEGETLNTLPSDAPGDDPERAARGREIRERVDKALNRLSPRQRMIFTLRHDMGYTIREIARTVGSTEGSVKKHLFRAVEALKSRLRRYAMEDGHEM